MNYQIGIAIAIVLVILGIVFYKRFKQSKATTTAAPVSAATLSAVSSSLKSHVEGVAASMKAHVDSAVASLRSELHPAAPAAPIAAGPPPTVAAPNPTTGAPSVDSGGTISPTPTEKSAMNLRQAFAPHPVGPTGILMLHDFKAYAAAAQNFLDLKTLPEKYVFYRTSQSIWPLQDRLGITGAWINALAYDGLVVTPEGKFGLDMSAVTFDKQANVLTVKGKPVESPVLGWASSDANEPPNYYVPLRGVAGSGADIVAAFLTASSQASTYLQGLGLTPAAIVAARD